MGFHMCVQKWGSHMRAHVCIDSLFIVFTATLRMESSWLSWPSTTAPNSPMGDQRETWTSDVDIRGALMWERDCISCGWVEVRKWRTSWFKGMCVCVCAGETHLLPGSSPGPPYAGLPSHPVASPSALRWCPSCLLHGGKGEQNHGAGLTFKWHLP